MGLYECLIILAMVYIYFIIPTPPITSVSPNRSNKLPFDDLKTGDMIFMSGKSLSEGVIRLVTFYEFSHVGLIIKDENETYLWEADVGQRRKDGPRLIPLKEKLKVWGGHRTIGVRKINNPIPNDSVFSSMREMFDWEMSFEPWLWNHKSTETGKVCCSTLVAKTLNHAGFDLGNHNSYSPKKLSQIQGYGKMTYHLYENKDLVK